MPRIVLLRHDTPDGGAHFDWLIAREGDDRGIGAGACLTFRVSRRIDRKDDLAAPLSFDAARASDHRPYYLFHEGDVSGGRGVIRRVGAGVVQSLRESDDHVALKVAWDTGVRAEYEGRCVNADQWRFDAAPL